MRYILLSAIIGCLAAAPAAAEDLLRPAMVTPVGSPHSCNGFYPESARVAQIGGVTTLDFHIATNGTVSHVSVAKSSGNSDLDDAAVSCVRTWRYAPTLKDGKAIEVLWSADAEWRVQAAPPPGPMPILTERDNSCFSYPFWAKRDDAEGTATLAMSISADGHPGEISFTKTSGNADLDKAAAECAKSMRFRVPDGIAHGVSAAATWSALGRSKSVHWHFVGFIGSEAMEALSELTAGVAQCLRGVAGHDEFMSGLSHETVIAVRYSSGEIDAVSVLRSSGNDPLDHFAAECFKGQPADRNRAQLMRHIGKSIFPIKWSRYLVP